jgi:hypothetical protein
LGNELKHELSAELLAYAQSRLKLSNFSVLVGLEVAKLYEGSAVLELTVKDDHRQIHNVVHGGVIATLADTAGAIAAYTVSPVGAELATCCPSRRARWKQKARFCGLEGILSLWNAMLGTRRANWPQKR